MYPAFTAITGRSTWPRTLRIPAHLRVRACADLGWTCLWATAKVSAIVLYQKCRHDNHAFAHAQLSADTEVAAGGWMHAARQLSKSLHVPEWPSPPPTATISEQKASLKHYRHEVVMPAVLRTVNRIPPNPALPWAWIAMNCDQSSASKGLEAWWQLCILGQTFPPTQCRWSSSATSMIASHHRISCDHFATMSWTNGIRLEKVFDYPPDPNWFTVVLRLIGDAL